MPPQPDDQVVPAGYQIGLMIYSTDPEFTLRPQPGTELTVDLAGTTLDLPVVGGPLAMPICGAADTRETVVIDGVDTGVPNVGLAGTCTVNDHVLDEEDWPDHGAFVRHTTQLADQLAGAGLITGRERGAILRAAAQSDV